MLETSLEIQLEVLEVPLLLISAPGRKRGKEIRTHTRAFYMASQIEDGTLWEL
jgi:hypothetical protein